MPAPEVTARTLSGSLALRFRRLGGRTVLGSCGRTPPLSVQRVLYLDAVRPHLATAILLSPTAGLFSGDRMQVEVLAESGAAVAVRTPSAQYVFAMPSGRCETSVELDVAAGAYLEYLPEPLILARDAALHGRLRLEAEAGALAAVGETLVFGRLRHGERFGQREVCQETEVFVEGVPLLAEHLELDRSIDSEAPGLLGEYAVYGALTLLCSPESRQTVLASARVALACAPGILGGASTLDGDSGIAVRVLGNAATQVQQTLQSILLLFREAEYNASSV